MIQSQEIVEFLDKSVRALTNLVKDENSSLDSCSSSTLLLHKCRQKILQVQQETLTQILEEYNAQNEANVSIEIAQTALMQIGSEECFDTVVFSSDKDKKDMKIKIKEKVNKLNEMSRGILCQLILKHYRDNTEERENETSIDKQSILEFLSLFCIAVKLPEVSEYISKDEKPFYLSVALPNELQIVTSSQRLYQIQTILLSSFGFEDPQRVMKEIMSYSEKEQNSEFQALFQNYMALVQAVVNSDQQPIELAPTDLDDRNDGGVTHVISVTLTSVTSPLSSIAPPTPLVMSEQKEEAQKQQLEQAQQTAQLLTKIRQKLANMTETQRLQKMELARSFQEQFLSKAMSLPAGLERIQFMQSLDQGQQEMLIMYKIYCQEYS